MLDGASSCTATATRRPVIAAHLLGYVLLAVALLLLAHDRSPGDRAGRSSPGS